MHNGHQRGVRRCAAARRRQPYVHHRAGDADRKSHCAGARDLNKFAATQRMQDIIDIDIDTGAVISGGSTIEEMGDALLERLVEVAIGQLRTKAELLRAG